MSITPTFGSGRPEAETVHGDPADYHWSSYRTHVLGAPDKLVSTHEQYERLGQNAEERQVVYRELFRTELEPKEISEIRDMVNKGWPLCSERFKDEIERVLRRAARPPKRERPTKSDGKTTSNELIV